MEFLSAEELEVAFGQFDIDNLFEKLFEILILKDYSIIEVFFKLKDLFLESIIKELSNLITKEDVKRLVISVKIGFLISLIKNIMIYLIQIYLQNLGLLLLKLLKNYFY